MNIIKFLSSLFHQNENEKRAFQIYEAAVKQARQPALYEIFGIPDTVDGRFDSIALHIALILQALKDKDGLKDLSREIVGTFVTDLDRSFREMGVGDLSVGKKVQAATKAFYGRIKAYDEAIGDETMMKEALGRNVFRGESVEEKKLELLQQYARRMQEYYGKLSEDDWNAARVPLIGAEG